jgi:hypothetical protein
VVSQSLESFAGQERYALLIGNARYSEKVGPLRNPHNDVALIAASLRRIGFQATVIKDATYRSLDVEIRRHAMKLRQAGDGAIGFFYYSGHGVVNPETSANYLIPVDVRSITVQDVWLYAFEQKAIIDRLSAVAGNATHFVVFDACRDELITADSTSKSITSAKGFVPIASKAGLLIAYATAPGKTASDEGDGGGPYATVLAQELVKPGVEAVNMFRRVQLRVRAKLKQDPWLSFPALPEIYLAGLVDERREPDPPRTTSAPEFQDGMKAGVPLPPIGDAAKAWLITQHADNVAILEAFTKEYPDSVYAKFARARIKDLQTKKSITQSGPETLSGNSSIVALQSELKRLDCYKGQIDGKWGPQSRLAIVRLNQNASTEFDVNAVTDEVLALIKTIKTPVCANSASLTETPDKQKDARGSSTSPHSSRSQPSRRKSRRGYRGGVCRDGNLDHCDLGCRKGIQHRCRRAQELRAASRGSRRGLCGDGNIDHCEFACARGYQRACQRLSRYK